MGRDKIMREGPEEGCRVRDNITRRQFVAGSLVFSCLAAAAKGGSGGLGHGEEYVDVELCLLRFCGFLGPFVSDQPEDPSFMRRRAESEAEADFVRGLEVGDLLSIDAVGEDSPRESGIGYTGVSSLSQLGFREESQVGLLESVAAEASRGTPLYAVVREAFYTPGIDFLRHVWLSVHAEMTPDNGERLLSLMGSEEARASWGRFDSDLDTQRLLEAFDSGELLPPP